MCIVFEKSVSTKGGTYTGLYSLAVGFLLSLVVIVIVSLLTKAPSKEITDEFDKVAAK